MHVNSCITQDTLHEYTIDMLVAKMITFYYHITKTTQALLEHHEIMHSTLKQQLNQKEVMHKKAIKPATVQNKKPNCNTKTLLQLLILLPKLLQMQLLFPKCSNHFTSRFMSLSTSSDLLSHSLPSFIERHPPIKRNII